MTDKLKLVFGNLPLVEAAVRVSFNAPKHLTFSLLNGIANELEPSFPRMEEPNHLEVAPGGSSGIEISPGHLTGAVYTGHKSGLSVAVQPQVIVTRWVRRQGFKQQKYPHFPALRDSHWEAVKSFRKFCSEDYPGILVVNMSYVNFVYTDDFAGFLRKYFSSKVQLTVMDRADQVRKLEAAWSDQDELDLRFAIEQGAERLPDGVRRGYRLTTAAGLRLAESTNAEEGLEKVHDALQEFFFELISKDAKTEWQLQGT